MSQKQMLETEIQKAICDYLALKKYFFWRQNTMSVPIKRDGKFIFKSMPKYARRGVPDIILIKKDGTPFFLEVKRPGGKLSEDQIAFERDCIINKVRYEVVYSVDDVVALGL